MLQVVAFSGVDRWSWLASSDKQDSPFRYVTSFAEMTKRPQGIRVPYAGSSCLSPGCLQGGGKFIFAYDLFFLENPFVKMLDAADF
jgi:hypothetical protein